MMMHYMDTSLYTLDGSRLYMSIPRAPSPPRPPRRRPRLCGRRLLRLPLPHRRRRRSPQRHGRRGLELLVRHPRVLEVRVEVPVKAVVVERRGRVGGLLDGAGLGVLRPGDAEAAVGVESAGSGAAGPGGAAGADRGEGVVR